MATDLEAVVVGPNVVGVMDHPRRQPANLLLKRIENGDVVVQPWPPPGNSQTVISFGSGCRPKLTIEIASFGYCS